MCDMGQSLVSFKHKLMKKCVQKKQGICEFFDEYTKVSVCPIACGYCKARNKPTGKGKGGKGKGGKGKGGNNSTTDETPYDLFKESIDEKIDPCNDFFAFACESLTPLFSMCKSMLFQAAVMQPSSKKQKSQ